jgi:hypothetical protein
MNKDKILRWLAEQVVFYNANNKPFKYFRHTDFGISAVEWKKAILDVQMRYKKLNGEEEE